MQEFHLYLVTTTIALLVLSLATGPTSVECHVLSSPNFSTTVAPAASSEDLSEKKSGLNIVSFTGLTAPTPVHCQSHTVVEAIVRTCRSCCPCRDAGSAG